MEVQNLIEEIQTSTEGNKLDDEFEVYKKVTENFTKKLQILEEQEGKIETIAQFSQNVTKTLEGRELLEILKNKMSESP